MVQFRISSRRYRSRTRSLREQWIDEHSAWLTWAMTQDRSSLPRIPRRKVDEGGFGRLLRKPGVKPLVERWWQRTFDRLNIGP